MGDEIVEASTYA